MFVELFFIKEYIFVFGDPVISLTVVLAGILVFSGLGGYWSQRIRPKNLSYALAALISILIFMCFAVNPILVSNTGIFYDSSLPPVSAPTDPTRILDGPPLPPWHATPFKPSISASICLDGKRMCFGLGLRRFRTNRSQFRYFRNPDWCNFSLFSGTVHRSVQNYRAKIEILEKICSLRRQFSCRNKVLHNIFVYLKIRDFPVLSEIKQRSSLIIRH